MSTMIEEEIQAVRVEAAAPRVVEKPRPIAPVRRAIPWGVLMVSGAVCFGVVTLMMAPTMYVKLVAAHTPGPKAAPVGPGGVALDLAAIGRGKALFAQGCNACHGDDAKGRPGLGKDLVQSAFVHSQSDAQLVAFMKKGRDASDPLNTTKVPMPPKGGNPALNDKQLVDLVAYMRGLQN